VDGEVEVDDGAEAVEVILETVLFVAVVDGEVESLALELEEAADNAMRDFSARGTCVWTFDIRAMRYTVLAIIAVDEAS
jgi:hypothetical protein